MLKFVTWRRAAVLLLAVALAPAWAQAPAKPAPARKPVATKPPARGASAAPATEAATKPGFSFQIGPVPAWVVPAELPTGTPAVASPMFTRVIDEQLRVEGHTHHMSSRVLRVVRESAGLPTATQIEIEFDPAYQTLTFHHIDALRGGQRIPKLERKRVELLQREKQLEQRIYDGRVTASVVLEDMRVGDEIDIAYTISGANPVFGGKFVHSTWTQSSRGPAQRVQVRLLAPAERAIRVKKGAPEIVETSRVDGAWRETVLRRDNVAMYRGEPGAPAWAFLDEQAQFSEFASWAEVAAWGETLFRPTAVTRAEQKADEIRAAKATKAEQVLEALRFVQQEVRYFGIEMGAGSHRPSQPDQVLEQRYGDCKDKVALFAALLRRMDIAVRPVLVSVHLRNATDRMLESPLAFDHVIARVDLDGKSWLLDPTRSHQSGTLDARSAVGMGKGLELAAGVTALAQLAVPYDVERLQVIDTIVVSKFDQPPVLESRIRYRGDLAEMMRDGLASQGLPTLVDNVNQAYVRAYPKLKRIGEPKVEPPGTDNTFELVQRFELPEFWRFPEERLLNAEIVQWAPVDWILPPKTEARRLPLGYSFPGLFRHRVRVQYPEDVYKEPFSRRFDDGDRHFTLTSNIETGRDFAESSSELRIGVDEVPAADWSAFSAKLQQALPRLGSTITVSAIPLQRGDALQADLKALQELVRKGQVKAVTSTQVDAQIKLRLLDAQLAGGRLPPALRAQALLARGVAKDHVGRAEAGRADFEAALAIDGDNVAALNGAATNAQARGDSAQAVDYATRVLARQPRDGQALNTRAMAHYFAGRFDAARADLDAVLADRSAVRRGYPLLWQALATRRAGQDLAPLLQKYPREQWPTEWPRAVLDAVFGGSTPEAALQAAKASKQALEAQTEALYYLGEKLAIEGEAAKAREQWKRVVDLGVVEYVENQSARLRLAEQR